MALETHQYVISMPYSDKKNLYLLLEQDNKWKELGRLMHFDEHSLEQFNLLKAEGKFPSEKLLNIWEEDNHTVLELFMLLNEMGFYQGMSVLRPLIDVRYHHLIKQDNVNKLERQQIHDSKIPSNNFHKNTVKTLAGVNCSIENNETFEGVKNYPPNMEMNTKTDSTESLFACVASSAGAIPQISYAELTSATHQWVNENILGKGGFGTVFKGTWKRTQVAIKRLETKKDLSEQIRQSITELHCLNAYRHDNILPLYGYSIDGPDPCLVYQYMPGGSLDMRIKDKNKILSWPSRLSIATGAARGLQFLHTHLNKNKPLVHGDIKSANILLDSMDQPKIGDFGLAREGPEIYYTQVQVTRVQGTPPYLPLDFLRSKMLSTKIDTYSFGVVLFELATGRPPARNKILLKDQVVNCPDEQIFDLKDPNAEGGESMYTKLIEIGKDCVRKNHKDRPDMVTVYVQLDAVLQANGV